MSDLSALLEREASAEIEAIVAEARERASALVAQAQSEAEQLLAQRQRVAEQQREATQVRAHSAAQLEASALKLRAQHAAVEGVFGAARERLASLSGDAKGYGEVLAKLLAEAVDAVGTADVASVHAAPADVAAVKAAAAGLGLTVPVEADGTVVHGVRVVSKRRSAVENTLTTRLSALEGELAADVSRLLFAPDAGAATGATEGG
ncbi:MAG: V-type ATP synthase subunit E [bacterium]|nr:V-type ATP synthase subunit E [bacterium]